MNGIGFRRIMGLCFSVRAPLDCVGGVDLRRLCQCPCLCGDVSKLELDLLQSTLYLCERVYASGCEPALNVGTCLFVGAWGR